MKNKKEFIELIERYETITLEEIKEKWDISYYKKGHDVAQLLTGFGGKGHCTLCEAVDGICTDCVYGEDFACINNRHKKTYNDIDYANTPSKLKNAFRRRAKHLRNYYKDILQ